MKRYLPVFLLLCSFFAKSQPVSIRVVDSVNNKPLTYAIIIYDNKQRVTYTDINGYFSLTAAELKNNDSIIVQYLGYIKQIIAGAGLYSGRIIKMAREDQSLQPVFVSNCPRFEQFIINRKKGNIKQYVGPGPETRLVIMARYYNTTGRNAYLKKISLLLDEKSPNLQIPVRLRWYEWDVDAKMPGRELTDTSIIVYPYKAGWNEFEVPDKTIEFPKDWVVFGFEFIYPPEYAEQFKTLQTGDEKIKWLNDMDHRWSVSMQYVDNEDEGAFYILNNADIAQYSKKFDRYFMRPAARFTILFCKE
jgi:CarboxypepD_reg-like domain